MPVLLNGSSDYVTSTVTLGGLSARDTGTVIIWFKLTNNFNSSSNKNMRLVSDVGGFFIIGFDDGGFVGIPDGSLFCSFFDTGSRQIWSSASSWAANIDHMVAVTWDTGLPSNNLKLYIDAVLEDELSVTTLNVGTNDISLGRRPSVNDRHFEGTENEFQIYNTALSSEELELQYNAEMKYLPLQIQRSNLQLYWALNEGVNGISSNGDTTFDLSGLGNNGTITGGTWQAEEVLSYPPGIYNVSSVPVIAGNPWYYYAQQ